MKHLSAVLIGTVAAIALTHIASAADLPRKAPAYTPPPPPVYNWTGLYIGGNVGYSWGRANTNCDHSGLEDFHPATFHVLVPGTDIDQEFTPDLTSLPASCSEPLKPKGMIAGGQIGYNYQINPTWVVSLEGDLQWSGQKDSRSQSASSSGNSGFCLIEVQGICEVPARLEESATADSTLEARLRWFSTVRGRAGVLITPTLLLYGTGGLAFGGVKVSGSGTATDSATGCVTFKVDFCHTESVTSAFAFSQSKTKFGWTLGGGVEAALAANWSLKAEYLYMDLGSVSGSVPDNFGGTVSWDTGFTDHIVRVGLNYRFY